MSHIVNDCCSQSSQYEVSSLDIDISGNNYSDSSSLSRLNQCSRMQFLETYIIPKDPSKTNYTFLNVFNRHDAIQYVEVDNRVECYLDRPYYISSANEGRTFLCEKCFSFCQNCYGPGVYSSQQCKSCINNEKFSYISYWEKCVFKFSPKSTDEIYHEQFARIHMDDATLSNFVQELIATLGSVPNLNLDIDISQNDISNFSPLSQLGVLDKLKELSL